MLSGLRFGNRYKGTVHLVEGGAEELFLTNVPPRRLRAANRQSYPLDAMQYNENEIRI